MNELKQIHSQLITNGLINNNPNYLNNLIFYPSIKSPSNLSHARLIFDHYPNPPTISAFNTMIRAYSKCPQPQQALILFKQLLHACLHPDNSTLTFTISSCAQLCDVDAGRSVHGLAFTRGFDSCDRVGAALMRMYAECGFLDDTHKVFDEIPVMIRDVVVWTTMVVATAKAGNVVHARRVFDEMPNKDIIAWNAMIAAYVQNGCSKFALDMFREMQMAGVKGNEVTMVSVLSACAHLGALDQGKWVDVYVEKNRLRLNAKLGTALLDMYAKCGDVTRAREVFKSMHEKNVWTWTCMMAGLVMHGHGNECLELFDSMCAIGLVPNEITFVAVLRACSIAGLVDVARLHFKSITKKYYLELMPEHYGCMVDVYGRAGHLDEALAFIEGMPIEPHVGAWNALLSACKLYKNKDMAERVLKKILEIDSKIDGAFVLLSNIYASSNDWDGVGYVRSQMKRKGVRKLPGCSAIEVNGVAHEFFVGSKSHPRSAEILVKLDEIDDRLKLEGYVPNVSEVLFDIDEEEKEHALRRHSEKLAIAFGLISLDEGMTIRIVKNLRVCTDCHDAFILISKVYRREIIVRDRNRFHQFKDGSCSCMGYW